MANRIKPALETLVNPDQTGFIGGRTISENIANVLALSDSLAQGNKSGRAVLLDFEKAFDSLEWPSIEAALVWHGFGPVFRSWIRCIQSEPQSCVINAGHFSSFFNISRGVRQGCPLSPYLFILTIEPLAECIRNSQSVRGIQIGNNTFKINLYADDMTLLLDNDDRNIQNALDIIEEFGSVTGLKLNPAKTEYLVLGKNDQAADDRPVCLLGVKVCKNSGKMVEENIEPIVKKMENTLKVWRMRNLSFLGKVHIIKSLCISLLLHPFAVLPNSVQEWYKQINTLLFTFLWGGRL